MTHKLKILKELRVDDVGDDCLCASGQDLCCLAVLLLKKAERNSVNKRPSHLTVFPDQAHSTLLISALSKE